MSGNKSRAGRSQFRGKHRMVLSSAESLINRVDVIVRELGIPQKPCADRNEVVSENNYESMTYMLCFGIVVMVLMFVNYPIWVIH